MKTLPTYLVLAIATLVGSVSAQQSGIINNSGSPYVKFRSVDMGDCQWTSGFWGKKFQLCKDVMVPQMGTILKGDIGHGYNNFKIVAGLMGGEHQGTAWHDGDFYKWMEAACHVYGINKDASILEDLDRIIEVISEAQAEDGYLHTSNMLKGNEPFTLRGHHEMYNSGHLMTAACIHYRVTGKTNFLEIAIKKANLLYQKFQPQPEELSRFGYNQTQIMGLVELYRTTGDKRYLELAEVFINMRGKTKPVLHSTVSMRTIGDHVQERIPLRRSKEAVGHAVLALYFYAGAADVYAETGEAALIQALDRLWDNVVNRKMYITGAVGQTHHGASSGTNLVHEAFIDEFMLPNATAYNETCANVCNAMFSYRMLGLKGEAKYADIVELVLFNSALAGISAEGTHYFYTNPLRRTLDQKLDKTDYATRTDYIPCFCCPPNLVRTLAKMSGWAYSLTDNGIAVNLYGSNSLNTTMADGSRLKLSQTTEYPWEGRIRISVEACKPNPFELLLRIPGWADGASVTVNGKAVKSEVKNGTYFSMQRAWKKGDTVIIDLPMEAKLIAGHPRIEEVRNQVAIQRGPVVYCVETADLPAGTDILDVHVSPNTDFVSVHEPGLLGGITVLKGELKINTSRKSDSLYQDFRQPEWVSIKGELIPYYAWSNRGAGEMSVWLPIGPE
ncbi:MAG: glycoside hydrolase family 127 protein [Puniceicoccaceae bacterium]